MNAQAQVYKPSGRVPFPGIVLMLFFGLIASIAGSYLYFLFDYHLITIILIFPLLVGVISGLGVYLGILWGKVRSPLFAGLIGFILGLLAYSLNFYWGYQQLKKDVVKELIQETGDPSWAGQAGEFFDYALEQETGEGGILGYVLYRASGVSIFELEPGADLVELPPIMTYGMYILELIVCALGAAAVAHKMAGLPYCEIDRKWYEKDRLLRCDAVHGVLITKALLTGNFSMIPDRVTGASQNNSAEFDAWICDVCGNSYLSATLTRSSKNVDVEYFKMNRSELEILKRVIVNNPVASKKP